MCEKILSRVLKELIKNDRRLRKAIYGITHHVRVCMYVYVLPHDLRDYILLSRQAMYVCIYNYIHKITILYYERDTEIIQ